MSVYWVKVRQGIEPFSTGGPLIRPREQPLTEILKARSQTAKVCLSFPEGDHYAGAWTWAHSCPLVSSCRHCRSDVASFQPQPGQNYTPQCRVPLPPGPQMERKKVWGLTISCWFALALFSAVSSSRKTSRDLSPTCITQLPALQGHVCLCRTDSKGIKSWNKLL